MNWNKIQIKLTQINGLNLTKKIITGLLTTLFSITHKKKKNNSIILSGRIRKEKLPLQVMWCGDNG
jgi:hypothetical protein